MNSKRRWFQFRLRSLLLLVLFVCFALGLWRGWEYLPGTLYFDNHGFPHGTGMRQLFYDSGALMKEEWIRAGLPVRGKWYRPDGSVVAESTFDRRAGGVDYYLRQDGSVRVKMNCVFDRRDGMYMAHGPSTFFAPDGTVEKVVEYRHGQPVNGQ